jgi:hypothetical protein
MARCFSGRFHFECVTTLTLAQPLSFVALQFQSAGTNGWPIFVTLKPNDRQKPK